MLGKKIKEIKRRKCPTWWDHFQVAPQPPWWWKIELNNPGWKLKIRVTLIAISRYLEAKFDYGYFILFYHYGSTILHKKFQVISSKIEGVMAIFNFFYFLSRFGHCFVYIFWNNGRILMFKVSKRPSRSARHDEIIFRWRHNLPGHVSQQ